MRVGGWVPAATRWMRKMPGYLGAGRCGGVGVAASVRWMSHMCWSLLLSNRRENSEDVPGVCSRVVGKHQWKTN